MTPTQREAALRLADDMNTPISVWADHVAHLLRELAAEPVINHKMTTEPAEPHYTITWDAQGRRLVNGELAPEHRTAKPAQQPQGEPVAWNQTAYAALQQARLALEDLDGPGYLIGGVMHHRIGLILPMLNAAMESLIDHPPQQRKPLTNRQAIALWADRSDGPANHEIISFARAIERAHDIKETP